MADTGVRPTKPRVVIASSTEGSRVAAAIAHYLQYESQSVLWTGTFELSSVTMDALEDSIERADFGVVVLTADDKTESRGTKYNAPRDNVLLELGMFIGRLGRKRTFAVVPQDADVPRDAGVRLPTDMLGVTCPSYDNDWAEREPVEALSIAGSAICAAVQKYGPLDRLNEIRSETNEATQIKNSSEVPAPPPTSPKPPPAAGNQSSEEPTHSRNSSGASIPSPSLGGSDNGWRVFASRGWLQGATNADIREGAWLVHLRYGLGEVLGFSPENESQRTVSMLFSTGTAVIPLGMNALFRPERDG